MKLIGRRKQKSPVQEAVKYLRLGLRGLVAQRVARRALRGYKWARRLPLIAGLAAVAVVVARKLRGGGEGGPAAPAPPPASTPPQA